MQYANARYLVGADGAASMVRRHKEFSYPLVCRAPREYVSIQQWLPVKEDMPYFLAIFDQYITDFYSWMIPENGRVLLGSAIPKSPDARLKFEYLKARLVERMGLSCASRRRRGAPLSCGRAPLAALIQAAAAYSSPARRRASSARVPLRG